MKPWLIMSIMLLPAIRLTPNAHAQETTTRAEKDTVVLVHGLVRTSRSMAKMARTLEQDGYTVINIDYPSRSAGIEELTEQVFDTLVPMIREKNTVHFVTHSLGGILLRQYLEEHELPNLGRVVMLAPPNRGSDIPDKLGRIFLYQWINGPAGNQLGTGSESLPLRLSTPAFELGIIAGDRSINPILSLLIPGPDDGKVSPAQAKPDAYTDYLLVHATHACMMRNRKVIAQTRYFLENGTFNRTDGTAAQKTEYPLPEQKETPHGP